MIETNNELRDAIDIAIILCILSVASFIYIRIHLKNIISYVIGDKVFKEEYKKQSFKDRFWFNNYKIVLPKWTMIWYKTEIICIASAIPLLVLTCCCEFFAFTLFLLLFFFFSPLMFRIYLIDKYRGIFCDYSKVVDRYAVRRKLYPELYEDDED